MAFYVGCYQILADSLEPKHDHGPWALPGDQDQHMSDTSNVEELFLDVTDMDVLPTQIQFGACEWTDDEGFNSDDTFSEFYVKAEAFYVRSFASTDWFSEFYVAAESFYLRSFSPTDTWATTFYPSSESPFYVRGWTSGSELYSQFYVKTQESFYVRGWTSTDHWVSFYVPTC